LCHSGHRRQARGGNRQSAAGMNHYYPPELSFGEADTPADFGLTGISTGAPLSLSKSTMNFAGFVVLAFLPTV